MPIFDGHGLVPPPPSDAPAVTVWVVVSSSDSDKEEEQDSAATPEGSGETSPPRKADTTKKRHIRDILGRTQFFLSYL